MGKLTVSCLFENRNCTLLFIYLYFVSNSFLCVYSVFLSLCFAFFMSLSLLQKERRWSYEKFIGAHEWREAISAERERDSLFCPLILPPLPVLHFLWRSRSLQFSRAFRPSDSCCCAITELSNCHSENDTHSHHQFSLPARVLGISGDCGDECSLAALTAFINPHMKQHGTLIKIDYIISWCMQAP